MVDATLALSLLAGVWNPEVRALILAQRDLVELRLRDGDRSVRFQKRIGETVDGARIGEIEPDRFRVHDFC